MFGTATRLAVLLAGRRPKWSAQTDYTGAPSVDDAGIALENSPAVHLDVQLREVLKYRRGRITVATLDPGQDYSVEIRQSTATYTEAGGGETGVINGLTRAINALRLDVRAYPVNQDGTGGVDTVIVESNHSTLTATAAGGEDYTITINGTDLTITAGSNPTDADVIEALAQEINTSAVQAEAYEEDTTGNGDVDTLFVVPVEAGTLDVSASATGTGSLTLEASGEESDNPHYGLPGSTGSAELALDADATELGVRYYNDYRGDGEVPDGWRMTEEWQSVDYRGLSAFRSAAGHGRGYLEIFGVGEGTPRSVSLGPTTLEGT